MKNRRRLHKIIIFISAAIMLCSCLLVFCGCPMPWYIPKKYGSKKMAQIYDYIKDELLTNLPHYFASIDYADRPTIPNISSIYGAATEKL